MIDEITDVFHFYDNKGDKKIAAYQIPNCLRSLDLKPTEAMIEQLTVAWKDKPDSRVSIEEFIPIYNDLREKCSRGPSTDSLMDLLTLYDREGNGTIAISDLSLMLQQTGEKMTASEVDDLLSGIETVDGKIQINDIFRLIFSS